MSQSQPDDLARLNAFVQRQVSDATSRRQARHDAGAALRAATLASDMDRDGTASVLNEAFAQGRLTTDEHADRTTRAFTARTLGELDQVLTGLQLPTPPAQGHPARKMLFWVVTVMTSPFLLMGCGMILAGDGAAARIFGIIVLLLFGPGLLALYRRAWPSSGASSGWSLHR